MATLLDYLRHNLATFDEEPFNSLDAAVLSQAVMVRGLGVVPSLENHRNHPKFPAAPAHFSDLLQAEHFDTMFTGLDPVALKENLFALAASPRFRTLAIQDYCSVFDQDDEVQFAAITYRWKNQFAFIAYRGTDTSRTGWKENFNLLYHDAIPSQEKAAWYLETCAPLLPQRLYLGGHSKGGNLAEYAALTAPAALADRIEGVWLFDDPGFKEQLFSPEDYAPWTERMVKVVPQNSMVGMILESHAPLVAVPSSARGIGEHSVFTWEVKPRNSAPTLGPVLDAATSPSAGADKPVQSASPDASSLTTRAATDTPNLTTKGTTNHPSHPRRHPLLDYGSWQFATLPALPEPTRQFHENLSTLIAHYDEAARKEAVDALFRTLDASDAESSLDLFESLPRSLAILGSAARNADNRDLGTLLGVGAHFAGITASASAAQAVKGVASARKGLRETGRAISHGLSEAALTAQAVGLVVGEMLEESRVAAKGNHDEIAPDQSSAPKTPPNDAG